MKALTRKLLRDLGRERTQLLTISLVMACGVAALISMRSAYDSLRDACDDWYARARFADVFVSVRRAPQSITEDLARVPGVAVVETRVVEEIRLDMPGMSDPVAAHVVSLPRNGTAALNALTVTDGRAVSPSHADEALVHQAFAHAWGIRPGDRLTAIVQGRRLPLRVTGIALSPEFAYVVQPGSLFPEDRRYGVLWMNRAPLESAFQMEGSVNDVLVRTERGAREGRVIAALDRLLTPYGSLGAYGRARHASARWIDQKIVQTRSQSTTTPTIFLLVAAMLVNLVLTRLLGLERERIATLKALGYDNGAITRHYLSHAVVTALLGAALGIALGTAGGHAILTIYAEFFRFPRLAFWPSPATVGLGVLASVLASVGGALNAVRAAVKVPPAEAMRPEPPARYTPSRLERLGLHRALPSAARMVLRELERRPGRAALSILGISFAAAVLVSGRFTLDSVDLVLDLQYARAQSDDVTVSFARPLAPAAALELGRLPGVMLAEGQRTVGVRLRNGLAVRESGILGLPAHSVLRRVIDTQGRPWTLPPEGLILGRELGNRLGLRAGDAVTVEDLTGELPPRVVPVTALVDDMMGLVGYMDLGALNRLQRDGGRVTQVALRIDPNAREAVMRRIKAFPAVASSARRTTATEYFNYQLSRMTGVMSLILASFAAVIAVGVVYNNARIALSVRSRELATLRVLGFTRAEVSAVLLGEQALQVAIAIPLGLLEGRGLASVIMRGIDAELFRMPLVVSRATYLFAAGVVIAASVVSGLIVRRRIDALDMVAVLKSRD